jgi:hypothetical protein
MHDEDTVREPYDASHRRLLGARRTLLAVGVVAAVVVAVAATALSTGSDRAAPGPTGPSPNRTVPSPTPPAPTSTARAAEIARDGHLVASAVDAKGSLMTVWQRCVDQGSRCRTAWQLQGRTGITRALVEGSFAGTVAAGDFLVVMSWDRPGVVLDDSGRSRPLQEVTARTVAPGDALVRLRTSLAVVDPVAAEYWPLAAPAGVGGWVEGTVTADGTIWATPAVPAPPVDVRISWLEPRATAWQQHTISTSFEDGPAPGPLAVAGDHVAALSMHDGVDVATYGAFAVTADGGASWSDLRPGDLPFDNVDAMAATAGGTLFVASTDPAGTGRVFRSTDTTWRHFAEVPGARGTFDLVAAGRQVAAMRGTRSRVEVITLDDAGHATRWAKFR